MTACILTTTDDTWRLTRLTVDWPMAGSVAWSFLLLYQIVAAALKENVLAV